MTMLGNMNRFQEPPDTIECPRSGAEVYVEDIESEPDEPDEEGHVRGVHCVGCPKCIGKDVDEI
jgi:hypothetical protein